MLPGRLHQHITELISISLNQPVKDVLVKSIGGGSINQTFHLQLPEPLSIFCKINSASGFPHLFAKEKTGLQILQKTGVIKVPKVLAMSQFEDHQLLLLEWIESGHADKSFFKRFGEQLAALHQCRHSYFGLDHDNYMGSVPQQNNISNNWCQFFTTQRLQPMVEKCVAQKRLSVADVQLFEQLYTRLDDVFDNTQQPALQHGDLWSGNFMCSQRGEPVLIDPAVYYGHPAADLGMTTLFGGFDNPFYESYQYHLPLPHHHKEQWAVCNLYPLLIHLYLFGAGYLGSIRQTLKAYA